MATASEKRSEWILAISAVLLIFLYLGYRGLWTCEGRWAEITREMFLSHDFFHPTINGSAYFDKPLLTYWVIAITSWVTHRLNEWTIRFPSALSGLIALLATYNLGKRLWTDKTAKIACWLLLTTYGFLFWARTGTADMENLAAIILAVAWYWAKRDNPKFSVFFVFYLICFIGSLFKGLTAFVCPVLIIFPDIILSKNIKKYLRPSNLLAFICAFSIYLLPFIYASLTSKGYQENGLFMVFRENIIRYVHPFDHKLPFYCYTYYLPMLMLPWTPIWIGALIYQIKSWKKLEYNDKWLMIACGVIFLFFTLSGSRRSYYILPILPFCCLVAARAMLASLSEKKTKLSIMGVSELVQVLIFAVVCIIYLISPLLWPLLKSAYNFTPNADLKTSTFVIGGMSLLCLAAYIMLKEQIEHLFHLPGKYFALILTGMVIMGGFFIWQTNALEAYRTQKPFALNLKVYAQGIPPQETAFYQEVSANVLFYLNLPSPVTVLKSPRETKAFLNQKDQNRILVVRRRDYAQISNLLPNSLRYNPDLEEQVFAWEKNPGKKLMAWYMPAQ